MVALNSSLSDILIPYCIYFLKVCVRERACVRVRRGRGGGGECCVPSRDQPVCPLLVRVFVVVAAAALLFTHRGSLTRLFTAPHRTAPPELRENQPDRQ